MELSSASRVTSMAASIAEPVERLRLRALDDDVVAYVSRVSTDLSKLMHGTTYHGAAQELEHVGRQLSAFKWSLEPRLSRMHPVFDELDAHRTSIDELIREIRVDHGYRDPWTPTAAQQARLNRTHEYVLGVELAHLQGNLRSPLEELRNTLRATTSLPAELLPVREQTLALIDLNLARMQGVTPDGAVVGYADHPDYAEIGRIQTNVEFMQGAAAASAAKADTLTW